MSKSREALIKRLNQLHEQLDNLPPEVVDRLAKAVGALMGELDG